VREAAPETTTDTEIAALEAERDRMLSEAAALREQAKATPGKEKYVLYGKEGALKSKAVAIDKKIEALRATPVDKAVEAQQPNTDPTDAQKEAGNYKKAHVTVQGMDITIENPKGSTRKGVDEDGEAWENTMQHHYGYFKRTEGKDGDHVDVFIGPNPESPRVFVVDQVFVGGDKSGQFDESKVMVGFNTAEEAKAAYMSNYAPDWNGLSNITEVDVEDFKKWLYDGKRQRKPFAGYVEFESQIDETIPTPEEEAAEMEAYNKRLETETREKYGIIPHKGIESPITKLKKVSDTYYLAGERTLDGVKVSGFMPLEGAKSVKLDVPGDFFAHKTSTGYSVSEGVTGVTVGNGKSAKEAVADANTRINANGIEKLKAAIAQQIRATGVSPRYQIDAPEKSKEEVSDAIDKIAYNSDNADKFIERISAGALGVTLDEAMTVMGLSKGNTPAQNVIIARAYYPEARKRYAEKLKALKEEASNLRTGQQVDNIEVKALEASAEMDKKLEGEIPTADFTFMSNSPMNKARALERLEKLIRDNENRVIPIYQWLEEMPRGLEVGMAKVHSRNDKGYTEKRTVGDHIVDTKAEQDYYNYLEEGGLPYSEHLKAEKVKADKQAEIDKIEREKKREADKIKDAERDARVKAAELRGLKELLTIDVEELIARGNAPLERDLKSEQKRKDSPGKEQQIAYLNRMIEQHDRVTRQEAKNAKEIFEIGPDGNPRQKYVYQPGDAVKVVAWNGNNPVETKIVQVKDPVASDNFPRYEVEPREGIHNVHLGYTYLRPVETPTDPKGGKTKEYINGGSEARKQELIDRIKNKLDNGTQAKFKAMPGAAIYDPELFRDGVELAGYFIQDGYASFPDYVTAMVDTFGDAIIPYLRGFYKGIYAMPGMAEAFPGRTPDAEVDNYDVYKKIAEKENTNSKKDVSLDDQKFIKDHIIIAKPGLTPTQNESNTDRSGQSGTVEAGRKSTETPSAVVSGSGASAEIPGAQSELGAGLGSNRDEERSGQRSGTGADARTTESGSDANNTAGGNNVGRSDRASVQQNAGTGSLNSRNYVIPRGTDVAPKGDVTKIRANIAAIKLAKKLNESGQTATPEQQAVLVKYTGWGGLSSVFKESDPNYKALKDVLTNDEYDSARASTTTSFYTPPAITSAVWDMISKLGFKGGITLEPSAGIGHFFGLMPQEIAAKSTLRGVELDRVSGLILKALYPDARINIGGFEEQRIANNSVDLVVTNVPFGDFKVHDSVEKDISAKFNIHDYFIAKSVRKLKPGGIGVFITTSSTMDKSNALRSWLINEGNADVIDVMRLNSDTFKQAAGTEATADIIIIRKRDAKGKSPFAKNVQDVVTLREGTYREAKKTSWGAIIGYDEKTTQMRINKYFVDNPDKMAGEMKFGFEGGNEMRPTEQRLAPVAKIKQDQVIAQFIEDLPADLASETKEVPWSTPVSSDGTKEGGLTVIDGKIYQIAYGNAVPVTWNENKVSGYPKAEVVQNYNRIKAAISSLLEAENNDAADIDARRKELNAAYDVFVKRYGPMHKNTKVTFLREDVDYPAISAIEDVNEKQDPITGKKDVTITKSDIFSKRVISKQQELKAENIEDGIRVSLYKSGRVDTALIADLLGKEEADVVAEILEKRAGFMNPAKGIIEDRDTYLSGNVREKLEAAEIANEHGEYAANIEELSKVVPADIPMPLIKVSLGSTWIPTAAYNKFFNETFGVEANIQKTSSDKYIANFRGQGNATDAGQGLPGEVNGSEIALDAMNNTSTIVYRTEWVPGEGRKRVKDQQATAQAATKQTALNEAFEAWCKSASNTFAEEMEQTYNKVFNAVVERKTDVSAFDTFPGASDTKIPRPHQKEGVLRSLEQATLLAHEVGTGKTITLISAAMEMRRLGLAKKPCIVVQRSTYEQFVKEIKSLYPSAKVLVPSAKDLTAAQREQLFAKIAYNDWDIVVLYHGYLDSIPDDPDRVNNYIDELIQEKIELMKEVADSGAENSKRMVSNIKKEIEGLEKKKSVKQEEKTKSKAEARAKKLMDRRTDNAMTFEQLGIDALLVDEAHAYKKLGFVTSLQGIKGIDTGASQRAQSLRLKTSYILENNNGKNVVFATGTPISNTMAEMWTFLRYLLPKEELSRLQMRTFDAFVNNFGDIVEGQEFSTSGKYKITNRFSSYANIPELLRPWKQIAHVVLTEEVGALKEGVGTPRVEGGKPADLLLKQTPTLKGVMKGIKNTLTEFENMTGKEKKEKSHIPLVMFGLAKRAAIDVRLVNPSLPDEADSKTNVSVKEIIADLKKTSSYNGTVAVFCDAYQSTDKTFNVFADMKAKLVAAGIPATQIAIVNDYNTDEKKAALWDKVNRGEVRVVFGTTEKLGVGVNIQERLHMLVHLDAPTRPSDYQQRNGRIMRQGNLHLDMGETIRILRVGVEKTLDVTGYQRLEIKKKFIDQIMKGDTTVRTIEEEESEGSDQNNFSQMMASLSGSQAALALSLEQNKLRKLENARDYHAQNQIYMANQVRHNENVIRTTGDIISQLEEERAAVEALFPAKRVESVTYGNTTASTDDEIANLLNKTINKAIDKEVEILRADNLRSISEMKTKLSINGVPFDIEIQLRKELDATTGKYTVRKQVSYRCQKMEDMEGLAGARVENVLNVVDRFISLKEFDDKISKRRIAVDKAVRDNEVFKPQIGKEFPKEAELEASQRKVLELEAQMKTELEAIEAEEAKDNVDAIDISGAVVEDSDISGAVEEGEDTDSGARFRIAGVPNKPNIQDFEGDQKAYENALKDYERKTRENAIFAKDKLFEPLERLIDTEYEVKQNEEKETIPISRAIDTYDIPPSGDVWEENYRIYTSARVIYNEDNIARAIYAEGADLLNPLKNRRHLLNFDRVEGVPQINIPNARRFRDEFNFHIERYVDKLARAKRLSTPAAQRYINEVIEEAAYAKEFYERYAAGEDVWRTQRGPAFRMVTIPTKPDFKDFNGDLGAYANALKDFHKKNTELVPEMVDAVHEAMNRDMDEFLRKRQDADRPVRQLQLFVAENGGTVTDAQDVYNDKTNSVGRSTFKAQEFERVQMRALRDAYRAILKGGNLKAVHEVPVPKEAKKITTENMRKIGAYLQAKDIQEAIELGLVDRGELGFLQDVGIAHEEYIAEFEANVPAKLIDALHEAVKAATLFGLEQELEGGLMTVDEFNEFAAREYYVPQRGWEERDSKQGETHYLRQGHVYGDPYNAVLVKAKGRESLASDPLKYIRSMGHSAILTAEKNKYKQKALSLVKTNISIGRASGAFNFKRVWYVNSNIKDADGNLLYDEVFERPDQALFEQDAMTRARIKELRTMLRGVRLEAKRVDPLDPEYGATMSELGRLEKEILFEIEEATESINIRTKVNDAYKRQRTNAESAQHEVVVYNNGERLVVYFSDERVANAINNQSEDFTLPKFLQTFGKATRWYSSMMTQYNPAFAAWNFMRDIQLANISLLAEQGAKFTLDFNLNIAKPAVSAAVWRHIAGKEDYSKAEDTTLQEFFKDGAATGFTYLKDLDQIQKNLRKEIEPTILEATLGSQFMLLNGKALGKAFAALTEYSELITRFAAYKTARDHGMSRERAATIAKNVTVNFNRKGSDTRIFSSMFAFFNASVQGVHRAGKLGKYGKVFGSVTALLAIGGFLNTLFNPNDPDDEKNWSEFDRMQNVIIGGVKLPVTHFFRGFWAFGVQAALAYRGEKSIANAIFDAGKNMTNELMPANINPVNAFKWDKEANAPVYEGVRDFVPSIVAPVFDIAENKSYTGATVYREAFTDADKTPQAFLGKRDVSPLAQGISNWLLEIGGGDKNIKDLYKADGDKVAAVFDVNPSAMEYLATSYTGGVGKFVMDSYKAISNAVETGEVDVTKLPVVNRAVKPYNEDKVFFGKYYSLLNKIDAYENSVSKREKSFVQDGQAYRPAIADFMTLLASPRGRVVVKAKALKKQVEALQDLSTQMRVNGKTAEADKYSKQLTSKVKEVDELLKEWDTIKD